MPASIFDRLKGTFRNGIPVHLVPEPARTGFSIMDNIWGIINTSLGRYPLRPDFGLPHIPDTIAKIPEKNGELTSHLKTIIPKFEPRVKRIFIPRWEVNGKGCFLECLLICELHKGGVLRFLVQFRGMGNNAIRPWRGAE